VLTGLSKTLPSGIFTYSPRAYKLTSYGVAATLTVSNSYVVASAGTG
jgi:hypothetical protein